MSTIVIFAILFAIIFPNGTKRILRFLFMTILVFFAIEPNLVIALIVGIMCAFAPDILKKKGADNREMPILQGYRRKHAKVQKMRCGLLPKLRHEGEGLSQNYRREQVSVLSKARLQRNGKMRRELHECDLYRKNIELLRKQSRI